MRRTLYVSDLDGTLLRSDQRTSAYTNRVINSLTEKGMIFSYATARSLVTAKKVTAGLDARIPLIIYNGAFIMDNRTEEIIDAVYFDDSVQDLLDRLEANEKAGIVYHREGIMGDYDEFDDLETLMEFIRTGKRREG